MESKEKVKCYVCQKTFKNIIMHLALSKTCEDDYPIAPLTKLRRLNKKKRSAYLKKYHAENRTRRLKEMKQNYSQNRPKKLQYMKQKYKEDQKKLCENFEQQKALFFKDIQYGPVFPCICCNRDLFERGVNLVTEEFVQELKQNSLDTCIRLDPELEFNGQHYLCKNCYSILKNKKKMPNICFQNGLGLSPVPDCLKLTDLENHLISKNLIFIKVRPSPRSRYDNMFDRIVNVPIPDDDIIKSVNSLPRNSDNSGLIKVQLKRDLSFKTVHKEEMIRPKILPEAVNYLKLNHPSYHDVNTLPLDDENMEESASDNESTIDSSEDELDGDCNSDGGSTEDEHDGDSMYNDVTCLVPDEPQTKMYINTTDKVINKKIKKNSNFTHTIAPGEGKLVSNWMRDDNFDVDAFPIHHSDGKYGLKYPREITIHPQQFYSQRIMNHDKRWSRDSSYLFVSQQYTERHALEREINISMNKGSMRSVDKTNRIIPLEKSLNILKKVPGTPSYWRVFKNDILAKVEQRGHFHIFFTLSCAERKWPEVLSALLGSEGRKITFLSLPWDGKESSILIDDVPLSEMRNRVPITDKLKKNILLVTQMFDNRVKAFINRILKKSGVELYAYRLEWQIRGMPHIHGVAWLMQEMMKKYINESGNLICNDALIELIDKWVSVSLNNEDPTLNELIKEVNCHKHTKSCKKYDGNCRYHFPRFPSDKTFFATSDSLDDLDEDEKKEEIRKCKDTLSRVKEKLETLTDREEEMSLKNFLASIQIDEEKYYKALGTSQRGVTIIHKRSLKERNVNNYNPQFMQVWQANMDIQFCTDTYAIVTYITDYFSKGDAGFEKVLKACLKENVGCDDRERLNNIKKIYFSNRQISASEAIYRLLPTLNLKDSNLKTQFVTSGFPENRSVLFQPKADGEVEDENDKDTYTVEGREELYKKKATIHEHYANRPQKLQDMCLAKFATIYEACSKPKSVEFKDQISIDHNKTIYDQDIPKWILLNDEKCMKARNNPAVLRIHSSKKKKHHEEQYAELLLFYPWQDESLLCANDPEKVIQMFNENIETILKNRRDCLPYSSMVAEMKEYLDNPEEMRPVNLFETLSSTIEQENEDDLEIQEPLDETPVIAEEDLPTQSKVESSKFKIPQVDDAATMKSLALSLSREQRMVFDEIIDYTKKVVSSQKFTTNDFSSPRIIAHGKYRCQYSFCLYCFLELIIIILF